MRAYSFAEVAIDIPKQGAFHYIIPSGLQNQLCVGKRVLVPFGNGQRIGFVTGLLDNTHIKNLKEILSALDEEPILNIEMLELTRWVSEYYLCSHAEAIKASLPAGLNKKNDGVSFDGHGEYKIHRKEEKKEDKVFLLHYKTKEKKLDILLNRISRNIKRGRGCIFLVPEISYVETYLEVLKEKFGDCISLIHSSLSEKNMLLNWKSIKKGKSIIALGTRMAVFAPFENLGLIIVDDEHHNSYKQEKTPRYDAVNVAIKRSELSHSETILASLTPRVESYYLAKQGRYCFIRTNEKKPYFSPSRIMVAEMEEWDNYKNRFLSMPLRDNIKRMVVDNKQNALILINRRGFSTSSRCMGCGFIIKCKNCNTPLVYHFDKKILNCHRCNFSMSLPEFCPACKKHHIKFHGFGTEKVESEIARFFPELRTERYDSDTSSQKIASNSILERLSSNKIDILIGTTAALKALDIDSIKLVAIISFDNFINIADFRSTEKTFQTLMHILNSKTMSISDSRLLIQTFVPSLYILKAIKSKNYNYFYKKELSLRKELNFPPYCRLANIISRAKREKIAKGLLLQIKNMLINQKSAHNIEIIGPSPHHAKKVKGYYIWSLILKAEDNINNLNAIKYVIGKIGFRSRRYLTIDMDPR
jgi:primosomal protein N' (replication factor Y)